METKWRTGNKVLRTVYENDQIMFLCTTPEDAARIVGMLNDLAKTRQELAEAKKFQDFANAQAEWSQATFGLDSERGPIGPLKHLAKEVQETLAKPDDEMEYVDCLFLILDASRRAKIPAKRLLEIAVEKLEINKKRKWNKPTSDGPVEHDRSGELTAEQERDKLREELVAAKRTIEVLSDTPTARALAAGVEDMKAGRIRSLDCIDGGCERDKLREVNAALLASAKAFHAKVKAAEPIIDGYIGTNFARTGVQYQGPNWGKEEEALAAAIALAETNK